MKTNRNIFRTICLLDIDSYAATLLYNDVILSQSFSIIQKSTKWWYNQKMLAGQIFLDGKSLSVLPLVTFYLSNGALIPLILLISEKKSWKERSESSSTDLETLVRCCDGKCSIELYSNEKLSDWWWIEECAATHHETNANRSSEWWWVELTCVKLHEQRCFANTTVSDEDRLQYKKKSISQPIFITHQAASLVPRLPVTFESES